MNTRKQRSQGGCHSRTWLIGLLAFVFLSQSGADPTTQPALQQKCLDALQPWKDRVKVEKLSTLVSAPFVLIGDGDRDVLQQYLDSTIRNSAAALWAMYFRERPSEPIVIFLFQTDEQYRRLSKDWFNSDDPPHFGYCRSDGIMVMNISTGGGTLVHELVHALIKYDFPKVPSWFNEGIASLYEQSSISPGRIIGLKNWRLPALKQAIAENTLRSFESLLADPDFYDKESSGLNYAQARYLMMYLQENGLLQKFYVDFRLGVTEDPTGMKTLKKLIAPQALEEFEKGWRRWVASL